jgi:DNA (cytosine-5)-methyltransferase 1
LKSESIQLKPVKFKPIQEISGRAPFIQKEGGNYAFSFIDLFAGIGGIRLAFQQSGGQCIFSSEWDKFAQKTYATNFGESPHGDITEISTGDISNRFNKNTRQHTILLAGFPCQAFSQAGLKKGFNDTRGTMFFEIQRILSDCMPDAFLLENVKQLKGHNQGKTLKIIMDILRGEHFHSISDDVPMSDETLYTPNNKLNYWADFRVLRAADFGIPQNRERIFIIGFNKQKFKGINFSKVFKWPDPHHTRTTVGDILESDQAVDPKYTISQRLLDGHQRRKTEHKNKGNGFGYSVFKKSDRYTNTLSARYYKDGSEILIDQSHLQKRPRKLTPRECANLQGFPENFIVNAVSDTQAYKQFGNSVAVPVVQEVAKSMLAALKIAGVRRK